MEEREPEIRSRLGRKTTLGSAGKTGEPGQQVNKGKPENLETFSSEKGEKVDQDGNVQRTIYFDPEQWRNLRQLRRQIEDEIDEIPNVQDMIRYLVATATMDRFTGFADFLGREKLKRRRKK